MLISKYIAQVVYTKGRTIIFWRGGDEKFTDINNFFFQGTVLQTFFFLRNAMLYYEEFNVTTLVLPLTE